MKDEKGKDDKHKKEEKSAKPASQDSAHGNESKPTPSSTTPVRHEGSDPQPQHQHQQQQQPHAYSYGGAQHPSQGWLL